MNNQDQLLTENIPKLVIRFALTTLVALILNTVYNLTDALFVSWGVGDNAMGGVSIAFPFVILQGAIAAAIGGGAATLVSLKLGKGDRQGAGEITKNAMVTFYVLAIIVTIVGLLSIKPILKFIGVTDEIYGYAKDYFTIILAGNVFSTGFSSIMRAEGKINYSLLIWVIPISFNIILDAVFILGLNLGVKGSALATIISQIIGFIICIFFFTKKTNQDFTKTKVQLKKIKQIIAIGLPSLVQMGSISLIMSLMTVMFTRTGNAIGVVAFAYLQRLITYIVVPFTAITQALSPIVGYNQGAGLKERVTQSIRFSIIISLAYSVVAFVITGFAAPQILSIFTKDNEVIAVGAMGLRILSISLPFAALPMIVGTTMQAVGKKGRALFVYSITLIMLPPSLAICSLVIKDIICVWTGYVIANIIAAIIAMIVLFDSKRKMLLKSESVEN